MSLFNIPLLESNLSSLTIDEKELKNNINKYINHVEISDWSYHFNRIFISPENSFNVKYIIKFLSSKLAKHNQVPRKYISLTGSDDQLISQERRSKTVSKSSDLSNEIQDDIDLVKDEEDIVIDDILDGLTCMEFIRLLDIEPDKRLKTIMHHYHMYNTTFDSIPVDKLDKLSNNIKKDVPYEIFTEKAVNESQNLQLLKTCGAIIIDISRDNIALSKGKDLFRLLKSEIFSMKGKDRILAMQNKRLIVLISTVMTWAGDNKHFKKRTVSEKDVDNRIPNPEFVEHYEFELDVFAVNQTKGLREFLTTIIVWSGLTYGFEQDLLNFAFDSACKNNDILEYPIPTNQNYVPVMHVENLARLLHKIVSEVHKLKCHCIFAIESPVNTLKQIITALEKSRGKSISTFVSLDTFINKYELKGLHKQIISVDIKVNSCIDRLWPNFEWYGGKLSIIYKIKSLVDTYKIEHGIKNLRILLLGPPASGKTTLARKLAKHYDLIHMESKQIVQNHISAIRKELESLHKQDLESNLIDLIEIDDRTEVPKQIDPTESKKKEELDQELVKLYASMDANNGVLNDFYFIPLLLKEMSHVFSTKRGYVLDGYPTTVDQAKRIFNNINTPQQIDTNKLPNLTICLIQKTQLIPSNIVFSNDNNTISSTLETRSLKRRLIFSKENDVADSNYERSTIPSVTVKAAKPILKKTDSSIGSTRDKSKHLIWNARAHDNILKMLHYYYVPIKTVDSPYFPMNMNFKISKDIDINQAFEQLLDTVVEEIKLNQQYELSENLNLNKTNSVDREINVDHKIHGLERLKEKMTLLEEFERITDFGGIERLSCEEYLMKYVTSSLTKLIVQVAKVRPRNPVDFLAYMALKENREGLPDFPGYSEEGIRIKNILERIFQMYGYDSDIINSNPLMKYLVVHSTNCEDKQMSTEPFFE